MEPFKPNKLPIDYSIDKDLIKLVSEANEKYGEYKSLISTLEFDSKFFLDSLFLNESLKSTQIEGTQVSQDEIYYLKYLPQTDDNKEIQNLKKSIEFATNYLKENQKIDMKLINSMHKILLDSVRGSEKEPGRIRTTQNWIGNKGSTMDSAIFVPPIPEDVSIYLNNLLEYMNNAYIDPIFVNLAISHSQFETIHAYRDGNGRLGRTLIPIQLSLLNESEPILFLSEVIELYKPSYHKFLNESRKGNMLGYIKFFLQCVIEQCNNNIIKINLVKNIYKEDMDTIKAIKGNSIYRIMPIIMKQIIFTKKEVEEQSGVSRNVVSNIIEQLVQLKIIEHDYTYSKNTYKYSKIYNVFVGKDMV